MIYQITQKPRTAFGVLVRLFIGLPVLLMLVCCGLMMVYILFPPAPINVLILGVDARPGQGLVTRTDSIMLAGITPSARRVSLLSIPRDLFISVPGYGSQRINTINVLGEQQAAGNGPELLKQSIALSFGVRVDRYIRLDFDTFEAMIDAVGGVTIDVERVIVDDFYPTADYGTIRVRFEAGRQHMDGARALIYARTRHSDDDYARARRQQQVVSAFSAKLLNPLNWPGVLVVLGQSIDSDLSPVDMIRAAPMVLMRAGDFERLVIDREYIRPGEGGAVPDYARLAPWINARFN